MLFDESQITHRTGTIIAHARLGKLTDSETLPSVSSDVIALGEQLRALRLKPGRGDSEVDALLPTFHDPVDQQDGLAAIEPVIVAARPEHIGDIGWVLVVRETR